MSALTTILTFLVVLSVLVFVHELGHFVVAKRSGIKVEEFGFGYPPRLFGVRYGETIYSINLLPLGGFVRMLGENGGAIRDDEPADPRAFNAKSKRARAAVLFAGSAMNLLLAPLLFTAVFMIGEPVACATCNRVEIYGVQSGSPAARAGLTDSDLLLSINGQAVHTAQDVRDQIHAAGERPIAVVVQRKGQPLDLEMTPHLVDGQPIIGIQLGPQYVVVSHPIWEAVPLGVQRTGQMLVVFFDGLKQMVTREAPAELVGPVGVAELTGRAAQAGINYLLQFTAFLSLNLAIFNLLPIPGLDGARLAFVVLETVRGGKKINPQIEGAIHLAGMALLITLMLYVSFNDVRRLVPG